ncbi:hypothetical protein Pyn_10560 [Prunus yedoensis var. nudiflora]|uniref:Uncharacterized protein n=1 Tax=Prunus yedoensis var. nudiflora TaxID=2094558 RepID=A0A314XV13_PRUYE|nr:hypothetical protein Pyn_10560 [Prunus yedoensis var. nudiflora]
MQYQDQEPEAFPKADTSRSPHNPLMHYNLWMKQVLFPRQGAHASSIGVRFDLSRALLHQMVEDMQLGV